MQRGIWSGRRDSNPRPRAWEAPTLPTELRPHGGWEADCNSLLREVFGEEADEGARWARQVRGGAEGDRFLGGQGAAAGVGPEREWDRFLLAGGDVDVERRRGRADRVGARVDGADLDAGQRHRILLAIRDRERVT